MAAEEAAALAELNVARNLEQQGLEAMLGAGVPAQTIINMYVEGNAVTTQDLADTITDLQYNQQRSGRRTIYSARAI